MDSKQVDQLLNFILSKLFLLLNLQSKRINGNTKEICIFNGQNRQFSLIFGFVSMEK